MTSAFHVFYSYFGTGDVLVEDDQAFRNEADAREEYEFRVKSGEWAALQINGVLVEESVRR